MNELTETLPVSEQQDAAWAAINTPLSVEELKLFCRDIERLFRINPMLEFNSWKNFSANQYRMAIKNSSQDEPFELETDIQVEAEDDEIILQYSHGIKKYTLLKIESSEYGSKLTITDYYHDLPEKDQTEQMGKVDRSLVNWADYLQRYLISWNKWSKFGLWRWYMKRIWQPMKPSGRRIAYMLWWISLVEVALITLGVGIYLSEFT